MLDAFTIAGGVALLLFAVRFLRKGLDRLFGPRLSVLLQRFGKSSPRVVGAGLASALAAWIGWMD